MWTGIDQDLKLDPRAGSQIVSAEVNIVTWPDKDGHELITLAFGSTLMFDHDVTLGPQQDSKLVIRRQEMAGMDNFAGGIIVFFLLHF